MSRPKYWVFPYGASNSACELVDALKGRLIKREGSKYTYKKGDVVINWGNYGHMFAHPVLNHPTAVSIATSKTQTFQFLHRENVPIPNWTRNKQEAEEWLKREKVVGRDQDRGSQGHGIVLYTKKSQLGDHRFYTKYFRKQREFRIHVFDGEIIFRQEKLRKMDAEVDKYIRSHDNGWIFAFRHLNDNPCPQVVDTIARAAVGACGLNFGGVDIGFNDKDGACVFEINTAPGIENSSLQAYVNKIQQL